MKLGYNLQVVLVLTRLLEEHLKYRAMEPEVELHLESHDDGDCVILTIRTPGCHWNLLLSAQAQIQLVEQKSSNHHAHFSDHLYRGAGPEKLAQAAFKLIVDRLPPTTYSPRP